MDKNRFLVILRREYMAVVGKKSFLVTTLLAPVLLALIAVAPALLMELNTSEARTVAVVDQSGRYGSCLEDNDDFRFIDLGHIPTSEVKERYDKADGEIYAILVIPANVDKTQQVNIYSDSPVKMTLQTAIERSLDRALTDERIRSYHIEGLDRIIAESKAEVTVKSHTWDEDGEKASSSGVAMVIGMALSLLTYMFVLMYGSMIMATVVEDKTNRIAEVIVSSCRPLELMMGKITAICLVGITQIAVWSVLLGVGMAVIGVSGLAAGAPAVAGAASAGVAAPLSESAEILQAVLSIDWGRLLVTFVLYFIGGYVLYGSLFAAFGSAVDQQSDAQQFMMPVMMIVVLALMIGEGCMADPDGTLGIVCSYIPFTSPIVMMVRLPYDVPVWEVAVSVAVLYATALFMLWFASRVYRTGILMYGRKPSFKELFRWAF